MPRHAGIGEKAEDLVLNAIVQAGNKGIAKIELLKIVAPMNQSTVYRIAEKLEKKGLIKIDRNGQRTRYIALKTPQRDFAIEGFLYGGRFVDRIFGREGLVCFNPPPFDPNFEPSNPEHPDHELYRDYESYVRYFSTNFKFGSLEHIIFEYVNQLGAFIISVFLNAMDLQNISKFGTISNEEKNALVMGHVRNAIGARLLKILWKFWTIVNNWILKNKGSNKKNCEGFDNQRELGFMLENRTISTANRVLEKLYPRLLRQLKALQNIADHDKEWFGKYQAHMLQREKDKSKCTHPKFIEENVIRKIKPNSRGKDIVKRQCVECKRWIHTIEPHKELDWIDPHKMADMR